MTLGLYFSISNAGDNDIYLYIVDNSQIYCRTLVKSVDMNQSNGIFGTS